MRSIGNIGAPKRDTRSIGNMGAPQQITSGLAALLFEKSIGAKIGNRE